MQQMCVAIVGLYLFSSSGWHSGEANVHPFTPIGILLAAIGALGRLWCSSYIAGNKSTRLVTEGPYSLVRNPLYFFSFIGGLGISVTTETLTIPLLFSMVFLWYHHGSMTAEEAHLRKVYGDAFHAYAQRVPRFWPRLSGYVEPGRWELSPAAFRRSLLEVIWFVVIAVAVHAIDDLREASGVVALIALP